ncbi:hypothetical protein R69888_05800 [Paraburkholderia haematera]|uniref:Uncharacterized protein n=1 Tax=Paraburkholderia haematera TaxID=2793077 RepID=A0ABN7MLD2_9BURK|nr:hypothetical protein R69888_05800 [Paraburkholderia haematera]
MLSVFDFQSDLPLSIMPLHLSAEQIGKDIGPLLAAQANLTEPLTGSKPDRTPCPFKLVSPIAIANIGSDFLPTPPPINNGSNQKQNNKNCNPNRNSQPKRRLQGIKRAHRAIHQRDQRNQRNNNRHGKFTRQKFQASTDNTQSSRQKTIAKNAQPREPNRYGCLCAAAQSFTAFNVFSTCFSGDRLVYS